MANTVILKRGLEANLPTSGLTIGDPFYTTDTGSLFVAQTPTSYSKFNNDTQLSTAMITALAGKQAILADSYVFDKLLEGNGIQITYNNTTKQAQITRISEIADASIAVNSTWSSQKIDNELANSRVPAVPYTILETTLINIQSISMYG
jgi:hypothetical protein